MVMYSLPKMLISMKSLPYHYLVMRVNGKKTGEIKLRFLPFPQENVELHSKKLINSSLNELQLQAPVYKTNKIKMKKHTNFLPS